jgi:hypothetical protein
MIVKSSRTNFTGIFVRCSRLTQRALCKHIPVGIPAGVWRAFGGPMLSTAALQTRRRRGAANPQYPRSGAARSSLAVRCEGALLYHLTQTPCAKGVLPLKVQKDGSDGEDFLFGEFRIDRERETVLAQLFSDREIARFVTEMRVGLL